jgi:hypothetical protein
MISVASQTIRKFRSGLSNNPGEQGMINEFQGIKITSMSMQSFKDLEGLASGMSNKVLVPAQICFRFNENL